MKDIHMAGHLDAPGRIRVGEVATPEAGATDILLRISWTGICGTDLAFFREGTPLAGAILGHEFAGTVVETGRDVSGIAIGDQVVANPMVDFVGLGRVPGSFAEYLRLPNVVPGKSVFVLPPEVSPEIGALVEPFAVGLHAVNRSRSRPGEKIVIYGAGPIGLCVLAALSARGVTDVLVVDPSEKRRAVAGEIGAGAVHDPSQGRSPDFAAAHFGRDVQPGTSATIAAADVVFDCAGVSAALDDAVHSLKRRGRLVLVADPHDLPLRHLRLVMLRELEVLGALAYDDEFREGIDLLAAGKVNLEPLITHRFPLEQLAKAFATQMKPDEAIKVLVSPLSDAAQS